MANRPKKDPTPETPQSRMRSSGGNLGKQFPFREPPQFDGLMAALTEFAARKNRSRNMAMVLLLAKAMRDAGLYEPPPNVELD